jgi:putative spermidine/putrescine transport system permease protein
MADLTAPLPAVETGTGAATSGAGPRRPSRRRTYAALLPFFLYVGAFLLLPTLIVVVGSLQEASGAPTIENLRVAFTEQTFVDAFMRSIWLSIATAIAGAIIGGLLAWAVATGKPTGTLRRFVVAGSGVLAQFGGVMLAFAFLATFGANGIATLFVEDTLGLEVFDNGNWLYGLTGLAVVYTYFQIPLMLIVFLPALDGLRREWWEASASLGGSSWAFWRHVGGPILAPAFLGALLLLFTNAFSAYATAAALVSQGAPIITLQIRTALTSEVILGQANVGKAMAVGMIVVVSITMFLYALIQRRASRWIQ